MAEKQVDATAKFRPSLRVGTHWSVSPTGPGR